MSRAVADPLYDRLLRAYPPDQTYAPSDWADAPMPAPLRHFLNHRLRHQKKQEFQRIQNAHGGWVRTQHPVVRQAQQTYLDAIEPYLHIPAGQWNVVLQQATRHVTAYLVRPVPTLLAFFFGDSDAPCPASRARWRMQYFGPYGYLREAVDAYIDRQGQAPLQREEVRTFLYRVEVGMTRSNTPEQWIQLLSPLFSFARVAADRAAVPASLLKTFFEQKSATDWVERIQADAERGVRELTPRDLRDLAWSPQDAPGNMETEPGSSALSLEEIPDPAPESTPPPEPSSEPYASDPYEEAARGASSEAPSGSASSSRDAATPDPVADALDAQDDATSSAPEASSADPHDDVSADADAPAASEASADAASPSQPIAPLDPVSDEDLHPDDTDAKSDVADDTTAEDLSVDDAADAGATDDASLEPEADDTSGSVWDRPSSSDDTDPAPASSWPPPEYAENWPGMGASDSGFASDDPDDAPEQPPESDETDAPFDWGPPGDDADDDADADAYDSNASDKEDADTADDAFDWNASANEDNAGASSPPSSEPTENTSSHAAPPPSADDASDTPVHAASDKAASDEETPSEPPAPQDDTSSGTAPSDGNTPSDDASSGNASDDSTPLWQRFQKGDSPSDGASETSSSDDPPASSNEDDNTPLWARFQSKEETSPNPAQSPTQQPSAPSDAPSVPNDLDDLEQRVFGDSTRVQRSLYVRQLFDGSTADYYDVLQTIDSVGTWRAASQVIARDVFRAHQVNIYSDAAVQFTDAVEASF